jgi:hypothetical protein
MREKQHNYNSFKNFNYQQNNRFKILAITKCYNIFISKKNLFLNYNKIRKKKVWENLTHNNSPISLFFFASRKSI